jgi:hypothetical protein
MAAGRWGVVPAAAEGVAQGIDTVALESESYAGDHTNMGVAKELLDE